MKPLWPSVYIYTEEIGADGRDLPGCVMHDK